MMCARTMPIEIPRREPPITGHKEDIDPRVGKKKKLYYLQKPSDPSQLKQMIDKIRAVNLPK